MYAEQFPGYSARPSEQGKLIVVSNPFATGADKIPAHIDDLEQNSNYRPLEIQSEQRPQDTIEKLAGVVEDGDLVYILSGDGLLNTVAQFAGDKQAPNFSLMVSDIGNACNAYHGLTDPRHKGQPSSIINSPGSFIGPVFPLRASIEAKDHDDSRLALTIVSVGALAAGAVLINEPRHRDSRWRQNPRTRFAYESYLAFCKGLPRSRSLEIEDIDGGNSRLSMDIIVANAPKVAKVAHFATQLSQHDMVVTGIEDGWHLPLGLARLTSRRFPQPYERIERNQTAIGFKLTDSSRNDDAHIQYDGEAEKLPAESRVTIDQPGYDDSRNRPIPFVIAP